MDLKVFIVYSTALCCFIGMEDIFTQFIAYDFNLFEVNWKFCFFFF